MWVRIKEGEIKYKGWVWIEVTQDHIINLLLREANNLIILNENNEIYVDLQLDDMIRPEDDFPVWVTTWKVLQENGWQQNAIILNWKTTSWDYARLIYAVDGNLYVDYGNGERRLIGWGAVWWQITWTLSDQTDLQNALDHKQDILTPWTRISITYDPVSGNTIISADISWVMTYKGNVSDVSDLANIQNPAIGDCYYVEGSHTMYAWDWTQWNDIGWTWIDLTNYFNKQTDTSDNITQWSTNLFVTQSEKNKRNGKQDKIIAWRNITIDSDGKTINATDTTYTAWDGINIDWNNEISNSKPFDPDNQWQVWQFLQKTQNGYEWVNGGGWWHTYTGWDWISVDNLLDTITNTKPFDPDNNWTAWQVLKKTQNGYERANESGGWGSTYYAWMWITIDSSNYIINDWILSINNSGPDSSGNIQLNLVPGGGNVGQVLKKTSDWYEWANESWGWNTYYAWTGISISSSNYISNDWVLTINNNSPTNGNINVTEFDPDNNWSTGDVLVKTQNGYEWQDKWFNPGTGTTGQVLTKTQNGYNWDTIDLPSGENNVKFWSINSNTVTAPVLQEIADWIQEDPQNGAIINDVYTDDVFIYNSTDSSWTYPIVVFYWVKRTSQIHEWVSPSTQISHGYLTKAWQQELDIITWPNYSVMVWEHPDDDTHTNYLSALGANYPSAFMPTDPTQPTTKQYVDLKSTMWSSVPVDPTSGDNFVVAGTIWYDTNNGLLKMYDWIWNWVVVWRSSSWWITNDTTGTTTTISKIWAWTAAELANITRDPTTVYIVKQS